MKILQLKIAKNLYDYLILPLLLLPSIFWMILDERVWPWDQAWYAQVSVELFYRLMHSPKDWLKEMISAFGIKAPGTAWLGQFFIPIGNFVGSIEIGLLLSIIVTQLIVLLLIYPTILKLTNSRLISIVCCLFAAASPLSVGLTHQYFVEPLQMLSIAWIVFIMVFAPQWESKRIFLHLISAVSLAMIVKITSPLYSFGAILFSLYYVWNNRIINEKKSQSSSTKLVSKINFLYISAFILTSGFLLWYGKNLQTILSFTMQASSGDASILYGEKADFLHKIQYWLSAFQKSFFIPSCLVFVIAILPYIFVKRILDTKKNLTPYGLSHFDIYAVISLLQIISILTVFSLNINQENRYLLPILPYLTIIISWILAKANQKIIVVFVGLVLVYQLFLVHSQALGLTSVDPNISYWLYPVDQNNTKKNSLTSIVNATCNEAEKERYNIIGLDLPWFNANSASYYSAKQLLTKGFHCYYTSLGYAEKDVEKAWQRLLDLNVNHIAMLRPDEQSQTPDPLNQVSLPILERIQSSSKFKLLLPIDDKSILLYKQVSH